MTGNILLAIILYCQNTQGVTKNCVKEILACSVKAYDFPPAKEHQAAKVVGDCLSK